MCLIHNLKRLYDIPYDIWNTTRIIKQETSKELQTHLWCYKEEKQQILILEMLVWADLSFPWKLLKYLQAKL